MGGFLLTEKLARKIGLVWGSPFPEQGYSLAKVIGSLAPLLGDFPLLRIMPWGLNAPLGYRQNKFEKLPLAVLIKPVIPR